MGRLSFIDSRKALDLIQKDFGFIWVGLRQADTSIRCPHKEPTNPPCPRCLNTGFPFVDYLVKAYMWAFNPPVEFYSEAGRLSTPRMNCIILHDRPVKIHDIVLYLSLDHDTGIPRQPFKILQHYTVADSQAIHGKSGRVEAWKTSLELRSVTDERAGPIGTQYKLSTRGPSE